MKSSVFAGAANIWRNLPLKAKFGVGLFGFFVLAAIIGPQVQPYDPSAQTPLTMAAPSAQHLFGTTETGQDVLSQVLTGIRLTLELALLVGVIVTVLSVLVGVTAAYLGGVWDDVLSMVTNVFLVIPALPLLIVLMGYLSQQGQTSTIAVLSILGWPWGARVIRAQTLTIRGRDFIAASRETGEKTWRIIVLRDHPERGLADRGQLRQHRAVRDRRLGGAGLRRPHQRQLLVARHDSLLGADRQRAAGRARGGGSCPRASRWRSSAPPWCCSTAASTNSAAPGCARPAARRRSPGTGSGRPTPPRCSRSSRPTPGRLGSFLHSFSRASVLQETSAGGNR